MFKAYLKIAFRNFRREWKFTLINLFGLTIGLSTCLLIVLFINTEQSFDKFIPGGENIYRVYNQIPRQGELRNTAGTPPMFATALQNDIPGVEKTLRLMKIQSRDLFEAGEKKMYEENGIASDPSFFEFFPLPMLYGSPAHLLDEPSSIVLSEEMSQRYFGSANPVGKTIVYDKRPFTVKGVFKTQPLFHLEPGFVITLESAGIPKERFEWWQWLQFNTYVRLKPYTDASVTETAFQSLVKQKAQFPQGSAAIAYVPRLQPLHKVHLYSSDFEFDLLNVKGNILYVRALGIISVFILLIACFNFINLTTAKSLKRAKEVGIRKTVGATRGQLIAQMVTETLILFFIAALLSVIISLLLIPTLGKFTEREISLELFRKPLAWLLLPAFAAITGALTSLYPATVLSSFKPVSIFKRDFSFSGKRFRLQPALVVLQFTFSALLIISSIVVIKQVNFLHAKDLGFAKEQLLFFPMRGDNMFQHYKTFKEELGNCTCVNAVSIGYGFPGDMVAGDEITIAGNGVQQTLPVTQLMVDHDYIRTLGLQLVCGRDFSKSVSSDKTEAFIINETAVKEFGYGTPQNAIGKPLQWRKWVAGPGDSVKKGYVIGVVKDFNYKHLYEKIEPAVLQIYPPAYWKVAVKINTAGAAEAIRETEAVWNKFAPGFPLEYSFLDENFSKMYKSEDKLKALLTIATLIAIGIACFGLLGLATHLAEIKTREIGIRKVLGSGIAQLVFYLSRNFLKLVLIALLIASPVAWYFMQQWLQNFAYKIQLSAWMFAIAALLAVTIAFITISFQVVKAAMANPVKSLRTE